MLAKSIFTIVIFVTWIRINSLAQELIVTEPLHSTVFEIVGAQDKKYDANGLPCAVVKVQLPIAGVAFEGPVIESQYHINEYWVWFSPGTNGTKKFRIKCPGTQMMEVDVTKTIPEGLQPDRNYAIKLSLPKVTPEKQSYSDLDIEFANAKTIFDFRILANKEYAPSYVPLAKLEFEEGNWENAILYCNKAIAAKTDVTEAKKLIKKLEDYGF